MKTWLPNKKSLNVVKRKVLIVGAGEAGCLLYKSITELNQNNLKVVGFVDDDPNKLKRQIDGIKVIGRICDLERIIYKHNVEEVFVALPSRGTSVISKILKRCEKVCIPVSIIPPASAAAGTITLKDLRQVEEEDLLNRETCSFDLDEQKGVYRDKIIMVTGAAGSVGSQLCRELLKLSPRKIVMLDNRESELFSLYNQLVASRLCSLEIIIADIRDRNRILSVFTTFKPEIIFHAAAYKHVPLMEIAPSESVKTNVIGTKIVLEAAVETGCQQFIFVSTDKAVKPANIMGASKRLAELLTLDFARSGKLKSSVVRFGNVLGSSGSVLPLFKEQIRSGGPITITSPQASRYFISLEEAAALLLSVPCLTKGGEIFLLDMGKPVKILDLANKLLSLRGLKPGIDIEIEFCGLRAGEKLTEELVSNDEELVKTKNPKIYLVRSPKENSFSKATVDRLAKAAVKNDTETIYRLFREIAPELKKGDDFQKSFANKKDRISPFSMNRKMETEFSYLFSSDIVASREDAFLLAFLKAGLEPMNYETALYLTSAKLNWQVINAKVVKHQLAALVYYHLKPYLDELPISNQNIEGLKNSYYWNAIINEHIYKDLRSLVNELNQREISFAFLKGSLLAATVYNHKPVRAIGDVDILIKESDLETVEDIVVSQGYQLSVNNQKIKKLYRKNHHHLVPYCKQDGRMIKMIEIHRDLLPWSSILGFKTADIWKKAISLTIDNYQVSSLNFEQMLQYLCAHSLFVHAKINLRQILDISLIIRKYNDQINWQEFNNLVQKSAFPKAVVMVLDLVKEVCATPSGLSLKPNFSYIDKKIIRFLRSGIFEEQRLMPPPLMQLLLFGGVNKIRMARKIFSPHPFHQLDPVNYSSNRWQSTFKLINSSISSLASLFRAKD